MRVIRNRHFWLILVLFVAVSVLHYVELIGITGTEVPSFHFGLTRHAFDRILFLLPVIYATFVFGLAGGLATCLAALLVMLPRAILISPVPTDALLEAGAIVIIGTLVCLWAWTRAKERAKTQAALAELESAHKILQRYVQLSRSEEKRLNVLHAISTILCGSLELKGLLRKATSMVSELMEVEVTLMFSVDEEAQDW